MRIPKVSGMLRLAMGLIALVTTAIGCGEGSRDASRRAETDVSKTTAQKIARTEVERGPVKVTVEVSPSPARLSDEPVLTLTISAEKGVEIQKPPFGDAVGDFLILDFHEPLPEVTGSREIVHQVYRLEPTVSGPAQVDPIVVTFVDKRPQGDGKQHQVETEALTVQVLSTVGKNSPTLADLKKYDTPVPLPAGWGWWWLAGVLVVIAVAAGIWWRGKRRVVSHAIVLTPREQARNELEALWKSGAAERDVKGFYVELTGVVRRYIERTTRIHAPEQTTEEFLREISAGSTFSREERMRLGDFLESADLVKFAKHQPVFQDIENSYQRARNFVGVDLQEAAA